MTDPSNPLVSDVLSLAQDQLLDITGVRWGSADLLRYVEDALRALITLKPDVYTQTLSILLVPGTQQSIPDNSHRLINLHRNMGSDGLTTGKAIQHTIKDDLDRFNPDWHVAPAVAVVEEYCYDEENPDVFWVNPPVLAQVYAQGSFAMVPAAITSPTESLPVKAVYATALYLYVVYVALMREDEVGLQAKANSYLSRFGASIGIKIGTDMKLYQRTKERQP